MKLALIYSLLLLSLNLLQSNCSENKIINKLTNDAKDLISGIFFEVKGNTWTLPDTCLNEQFVNDISGFLIHLKKLQTNFCSAYLTRISFVDIFDNCPADDIINLYRDIKKSIESDQIYINSLLNIKKIISLFLQAVKTRKFDSYDMGILFGKLINLSVYGKNQSFLNSNPCIDNEKEYQPTKNFFSAILKNIIKYISGKVTTVNKELIEKLTSSTNDIAPALEVSELSKLFTKNNNYKWGFILDNLLEKFGRSKESTILKKFLIYSLISLEYVQDYIRDFNIEEMHLSVNHHRVFNLADLLSNMLGNNLF